MLRATILAVLAAIALADPTTLAYAQVSVNIGIDLPGPPSLVIIPRTPVAYAPAVPANIFFYGGHYYVFANRAWYVGPTYQGPWAVVAPEYVPAPILLVPVRYYRAPLPSWRHTRREAPPPWDALWTSKSSKADKEEAKAFKKAHKEEKKALKKAWKEEEKGFKKERKEFEKRERKD